MTTATKETMKTDAEKAALKEQLIEALDISASESEKIVNGLYDKYGNQAKKIAQDCLRRPYEIRDALGMKGRCTSRSMLNYFNDEKRSADVVNKALAPKDNTISTNDRKKTKTAMQQDATAAQKATAQVKENKSNIGNYDWKGNQTPAYQPKPMTTSNTKAASATKTNNKKTAENKKANDEATRKERAAKAREELKKSNIGNYDWAANQNPAYQPQPVTASNTKVASASKTNNTKAAATTAKKQESKPATTRKATNTATQSNISNYDWAANQTPAYKPQPITAGNTQTASAAKANDKKAAAAKKTKDEAATRVAKAKEELKKANIGNYDWAANQTPAYQPQPVTSGNTQVASATKTNNTKSAAATAKKQETKSATTQTTTNTTTRSNTGTYDWKANQTPAYQPQPIHQEAKVLTPEEKLAQAKGNKGYITFDDLKKDGIEVTATDLQTVINKQYSLNGKAKVLNSITPGKRAKDLADYMTRNTSGRPQGGCLGGVQTGMAAVYGSDAESPLNGQSSDWNDYKDHRWESNSACDAHNLLDKSGDWVTVDIRNSAYHNPSNNIEMQNFNNKLRSGTIASTDNRAIEGSRGYENSTASAKHGHIWVRDNKGRNCSDGIQLENGIDFSRYGKEMHISISTDSRIPDDLALQLIAEAEKRRAQYTILQENVYTAKVR